MRVVTVFLLVVIFRFSAFAQVVIGPNAMPAAGDNLDYVQLMPNALNSLFNKTGKNQSWNFNQQSRDTVIVEYKRSNQTPYSFYFVNTVGLKIADTLGFGQFALRNVYQFFSKNLTEYRADGLGFTFSLVPLPLAGNYSDKDEIYFFPLRYGNRDSSTFKVTISIPTFGSYQQQGYRITQVLGEGTCYLKQDTLPCILVRSDLNSSDSIKSSFASFGFPNTRTEYKWLSPDTRGSIAEITGANILGNFTPATAQYRNTKAKGVDSVGTSNQYLQDDLGSFLIKVFPNPTSQSISIEGNYETLTFIDSKGSSVAQHQNKQHIELADMKPGLYVMRFTLGDKLLSSKLVVE
jgi:hypothetical protein